MSIEPTKLPIPGAPIAPFSGIRAFDDPELFDIESITRRWQPTGYRVIVKMPYVSDDYNPMFGIVVNPYLPCQSTSNSKYYSPIYPLPNTSTGLVTENTEDIPIQIVRYDLPPPLSMLSTAFKFWSGSLKYRLRVVSGAFSQGYIVAGVKKGIQPTYLWPGATLDHGTLQDCWRQSTSIDNSYSDFMINSYTMSDLALYRHLEIEVPYTLATPLFDQSNFLANLSTTTRIQPYLIPLDMIIVGARGTMTPTTGTTELVIEVEYCGGDDFTLMQELNLDFATWNTGFGSSDILTYPQKHVARKKDDKKKEVTTKPPPVAV